MNGKVKKVKDPNAPPTGFDKPVTISKELATFLGTPVDEKISRSSVTSRVSTYCKESGLQKVTDGRKIIPDKKLSTLLNIKQGVETNFFELQKHLANHYPETVAKKAAAAAKNAA
jgi:chromatin remodeling complex protein RSC6